MSIPNLRAIRDWCKEKFKKIEDSLTVNGTQVYLDCQDGKYGVNTDPERGADTFTPFKSENEGGSGSMESPLVCRMQQEGEFRISQSPAINFEIQLELPLKNVSKIKKLVLKTIKLAGRKMSSSAADLKFHFRFYGVKFGKTDQEIVKDITTWATSTTLGNIYYMTGIEIDLTGWESVNYFSLSRSAGSSASYYNLISGVEVEIETYF